MGALLRISSPPSPSNMRDPDSHRYGDQPPVSQPYSLGYLVETLREVLAIHTIGSILQRNVA